MNAGSVNTLVQHGITKFGILLRMLIFEYESTRIAICEYSMVVWSVKKAFKKTFEEPPWR